MDSEFSERRYAIVEVEPGAAHGPQREIIGAEGAADEIAALMRNPTPPPAYGATLLTRQWYCSCTSGRMMVPVPPCRSGRANNPPNSSATCGVSARVPRTATFHVLPVPDKSKFIEPVLALNVLRAAGIS